tara:strand:- start:12 stop:689 length:678 start_codon:yes stop_codon:yes gene_type:complete
MNISRPSKSQNTKLLTTLGKVDTSFGYFIPILYQNIPIKIQTPIMTILSNNIDEANIMTVNLGNNGLSTESARFSTFIDSIEKYAQNYLFEKKIVEYVPFLITMENYYRFKLPINYTNQQCLFDCYDEKKNHIDLSDGKIQTQLRKDSNIKLILKCYGIYYKKKTNKYGLLWNIEQVKILPFERTTCNYFDNLCEEFENYSIIGNESMLDSIKQLSNQLKEDSSE